MIMIIASAETAGTGGREERAAVPGHDLIGEELTGDQAESSATVRDRHEEIGHLVEFPEHWLAVVSGDRLAADAIGVQLKVRVTREDG
jgi:hypothetical protein